MTNKKKRICVIGAGPSGMSVLYHYNKLKQQGKAASQIVCYDKQSDWGGLWLYSWETGFDQYGEPVHGSMYRGLWSNGPKECVEYPDYTFEDHFKRAIPSYPPREVLFDYLKGRWSQSDLRQWIKFNHVVRHVTYNDDTDDFSVVVRNMPEDKDLPTQRFDYVIVACGHYSVPNIPYFEGIDQFPGRLIHSHDFRNASQYKDNVVLVLGSKSSAEDMATQIIKYGAKKVFISYRTMPMGFKWPPEIEERPLVTSIQGNTVHFKDGSSAVVDSIILCTGYIHKFPFMEERLCLKTKNVLYPPGLYKGILWCHGGNNKVMYIGMQKQVYTFTMFDAQAKWIMSYISGDLKLPDRKLMWKDINTWTESSSVASLVCLAPHFRLLRICEQSQHNDELEGIDALLGCPLISFKPSMLDNLHNLTQADREVICGALFYTVNWFIELINGFSTQSDPEMRGKTLTRLNDITCLYKNIETVLTATPTFSPSLATFDCESPAPLRPQPATKGKRPRKQAKGNDTKKLDETIEKVDKENDKELDASSIAATAEKTDKRASKADKGTSFTMAQCRPYLRELDLNVFNLLKCGFVTRSVLDSDMNTEEKTILRIQAPHLFFLLDDLSRKLNHSLSASASSRRSFLKARHDKQVGFSNLSRHSAREFAKYMVDLLPTLCEHLESTSAFFQTMLVANDGMVDGPGSNTEEASTMSQCYHLLFSCFQTLFSWNGFLVSSNLELYKRALTVLSSRTKLSSTTQAGLQDLLKQSFHYLEQFASTITDMATALTLTKLLVVISERADNNEINTAIAELTGGFLKKDWIKRNGEKESGPKYNEALQYLLRFYLSFSEDPMPSLEEISAGAFTELINEENDGVSTSYPTLTRATVPSFYRGILEELISYLKLTQSTPIKRTDMDQAKQRLTQLNIIVREFHIIINLVKVFEQRQVLSSALKFGRVFVETFLRIGMPVLDQMLRSEKDTVHGLLKNLQQSTRCLQHFCGHTKVAKDIALTNHVPAVKKTLELFVFRVKAMLALNECHEAFWMGNLKNRDIQGQEILSQQSTKDDDDKGDDDDEEEMDIDKDDEEEDEEGDNAEAESVASHDTGGDENDDDDSCSEVF